jgi:hypothetical protein
MSILTEAHHNSLDKALGELLTAYGRGQVDATGVVWNIMHMVEAVDNGNITEVITFIGNPLFKLSDF